MCIENHIKVLKYKIAILVELLFQSICFFACGDGKTVTVVYRSVWNIWLNHLHTSVAINTV